MLEDVKGLADKIDRKALAGAVGIMLMSWLGLPIVYWLIVRKKKQDKNLGEEENKNGK